jgi:chorismate dehydratase
LARWAEEGRVDAGVIPVVDAWRLKDTFEPVGSLGIAVKRRAMSVLLFSKRPWNDLENAPIGLTDDSSTSARLLQVLLNQRDGRAMNFRTGFHPTDEARLVIGDAALIPEPGFLRDFPMVIDLGEEWARWQGMPFVFARWMVRRSINDNWKNQLEDALENALDHFAENRSNLVRQAARSLRVPFSQMDTYYDGLVYRLSERELLAENTFRDLVLTGSQVVS